MATLSRQEKLSKVEAIYQHCKSLVLSDKHLCEQHEAIRLGAFILQAENGDYDPVVHTVPSLTDLRMYLPHMYAIDGARTKSSGKALRKLLLAEYSTLAGTNTPQAKLRFARICKASSTFGIEFTQAHTRLFKQTSMSPTLVGFSATAIVVLDYKTKALIQKHDLTKVVKWQGKPIGLQIDFRDHNPSSVFFATAGESSTLLAHRATAAIHQMLGAKRKKKAQATVVPEDSSADDTFDGFADDGAIDTPKEKEMPYRSLGRSQSGFLSGINMTAQRLSVMDTNWFSMESDAMSTLSRQTSAASGVTLAESEIGDDHIRDEWEEFLDDSSEDITTSAGILDSVARLGPKRSSAKWCMKNMKLMRSKVKAQVLGIAQLSKRVLPIVTSLCSSSAGCQDQEQRDKFTKCITIYCKTLPPLAGHIVTLCALATLPGQSELIMAQAGDLWIGILQIVQAVKSVSKSEAKEGLQLLASAAKSLLQLITTLTTEEKIEAEHKALEEAERQRTATEQQRIAIENRRMREEANALAQAEAAMKEVERKAQIAMNRKAEAAARADAEAEAEKRREEIARERAVRDAERFAKAEAKRIAKEEAEKLKREHVEEQRRLKAEEALRKKAAKEEADRIAKIEAERKAAIAAEKRAKFGKLLAKFEPNKKTDRPSTQATSAVLASIPREQSKPKYGRDFQVSML